MSWFSYIAQNPLTVLSLTGQHALLSVEGTVLGALVAVPLGILAYRKPRIRQTAKSVTEVIQTVPSLALMAVLMLWLGIGDTTMVATLFLYALMPLLHNTIEGLRSVDTALLDVAEGMGMSRSEMLWRVQIPVAAPLLLTGFRVALVTSIGIATMGVFIGAGGLGNLIYGGMQVMDPAQIFAGAAPAALLAIVIDLLLTVLSRSRRARTMGSGTNV